MKMPRWYREKLMMAFAEKNVFTIIQLNKNLYKTLNKFKKKVLTKANNNDIMEAYNGE